MLDFQRQLKSPLLAEGQNDVKVSLVEPMIRVGFPHNGDAVGEIISRLGVCRIHEVYDSSCKRDMAGDDGASADAVSLSEGRP